MINEIPEYNEWVRDEFTQKVMRDIYDTLVLGAEKRPFWSYIVEATQQAFNKQRWACFRHSLALHEASGDGHSIDKDSDKPHLANCLARAFIARGQQIELLNGESMKDMEEVING